MTTLDLDRLKQRWSEQSRAIDAQLALDVDAVRRRLTAQTATALVRQRNRRLYALLFGGVAFVATLGFMRANVDDAAYLLLALPFALLLMMVGAVDLREWLSLGRVDFARPLTELRAEYDRLRARRLQIVRVIAQLSVLLWLPLIFVLVKGLAGVDLLRRLPFSVTAANVALGVALVPCIALIVRWLARRRPTRPRCAASPTKPPAATGSARAITWIASSTSNAPSSRTTPGTRCAALPRSRCRRKPSACASPRAAASTSVSC